MFVARPVCAGVRACVRGATTVQMVPKWWWRYHCIYGHSGGAGVQDGTLSERLGDGAVSVFFCRRPTSMRAPRHSLQVRAAVARC